MIKATGAPSDDPFNGSSNIQLRLSTDWLEKAKPIAF
jgi:hypothetical protein